MSTEEPVHYIPTEVIAADLDTVPLSPRAGGPPIEVRVLRLHLKTRGERSMHLIPLEAVSAIIGGLLKADADTKSMIEAQAIALTTAIEEHSGKYRDPEEP